MDNRETGAIQGLWPAILAALYAPSMIPNSPAKVDQTTNVRGRSAQADRGTSARASPSSARKVQAIGVTAATLLRLRRVRRTGTLAGMGVTATAISLILREVPRRLRSSGGAR